MARTAVGHFHDRPAADAAYEELLQRGFSADDVSIMGRAEDSGDRRAREAEHGEHLTTGQGIATGGIVGLLLGAAAMLIPGIGPIVAVGPIAAALAGAVTGGVTGAVVGGITGALVDAGVEEEEARYYEDRFKGGGVLLTVHTDDARYDEARAVLERHGSDARGERAGPEAAPAAGSP